jgi:phosphatidylserine/phosphatidylglycerophosphate/cardiolipin synthase-like enzyme
MLRPFALLLCLTAVGGAVFGWSHARSFTATGTPQSAISIYFAPEQDIATSDRAIIHHAQHSLQIAMYSFTDRRIAKDLVDACRRGVEVDLYRDREQFQREVARGNAVRSILAECRRIHVRVKGSDELMHMKAFVADGSIFRQGSGNWSVAATRDQDNEVSVSSDITQIKAFDEAFAAMWQRNDNEIIQ